MLSLSSRSILKRSFLSQPRPARFYSSTIHDNDPHTLELEKQRNLANKQHATSTPISEARGWNEFLATTSEAYVKADQSKDQLTSLASKTVQFIQSRHNPDERVGSREATYERDSVEGPLGSDAPDAPDQAGPKIKAKAEATKEALEDATPSEQAIKSDRGEV